MVDIQRWFNRMQNIREADRPIVRAGGRMLTPREIINEVDGPLWLEIKRKMGW